MAKKSRRPQGHSKKWSRANTMNFVLGGVVAVSMILGSVVAFGGAATQPAAPEATAPIVATAPAPAVVTAVPAATPTPAVSPTAAISPTLAPPSPTP